MTSGETTGTVTEEASKAAETEAYTTFNEVSGEAYEGVGESASEQGSESVSETGSYTSTESASGFSGETSQGQYDASASHGTYNASPNQGGFNADVNQGSYNGSPNQGGFNADPNRGSFNGAPKMNVPKPASGISTIGQVFTIIAIVLMFFQCFRVIGSFFGILTNFADEGFPGLLYGILSFFFNVIKLGGLALSAVTMYLIWKKWDDSKAEPLMVGVMTGGVLILATVVLRAVFASLFNYFMGYEFGELFSGAFLSVIFSAAMMALVYMKITEKQIDPVAGLKSNFGNGFKDDMKTVSEMALQAKNEYQAGKNANMHAGANAPAGNGMNRQYNCANGNYNPNGQPYGTPAFPLSTDRSIVAYILLGIVTCGIYDLYMLHLIIQDVNVTCAGDGKVTKGILEYILFGILTCGIYDYVWLYNLGNRIQNNAPRYGMRFDESGTSIILWWILGAWLCGIGPFYAMHLIIKNTNALNAAYNNMIAQQINQ